MDPIDTLRCPGFSALLHLPLDDGVGMREFASASRASAPAARRALMELERLGLVESATQPRGAASIRQIRLTRLGRDVARQVRAIDQLLKRAPGPL